MTTPNVVPSSADVRVKIQSLSQYRHLADIGLVAEGIYYIRQKREIHFEAPFMYLILGDAYALLLDTGAISDPTVFPLRDIVFEILHQDVSNKGPSRKLIVSHTHSHFDHVQADMLFQNDPDIFYVEPNLSGTARFFKAQDEMRFTTDLGNRPLNFFWIPGHDKESLAIHDRTSNILLTGDTFYPGRLFIEDWQAFKETVHALLKFSIQNDVDVFLGNHIEMGSQPFDEIPEGSISISSETHLNLNRQDLLELHNICQRFHQLNCIIHCKKFILVPTY